jgi:multiple sugar transport system permease protein
MSRATRRQREEAAAGWLFMSPALLILLICMIIPMLVALGLSFTHCSRFLTVRWAGLYNYEQLLTDPLALRSLLNTLFYVVVFVPSNAAAALCIALLLNRTFPGIRLVRAIYFVPVVLSMVVAVSIWRFLYDYQFGPINAVLDGMGLGRVAFLDDARFAMLSIIAVALWKSSAFFSIILLAALQDVPKELHEAAMVDGARPFRRFLSVTLPSISPVLYAVVTLSSVQAFRVFVPMFVLTEGGPAFSTRTIALHAYSTGFDEGALGESSAVSFFLLAVVMLATLGINRLRARLS